MVPVRKPGRPLSSCPHPSSGPCSCSGVTAAIPKKQACRCGSSSSKAPVTVKKEKTDGETSSGANTPPSPSKASSSSFRVSKAASKANSRKPSLDPAGLARMDPAQYQILSPTEAAANGINGISVSMPPPVSSYGPALAMTTHNTQFTPIFQQPPPPLSAAPTMQAIPAPQTNGGSCCGGSNESPVAEAPKQLEEPAKGCCSTNSTKTGSSSETQANKTPHHNGVVIPPQGGTVLLPNGMYAFYQPPTIFNYPPQYGSYMQPLQPEQWRQVMTTLSYTQPAAAQQPPMYGIQATMPAAAPATNGSSAETESWTSHQCTCGDGCQCVGCAAHPYNDATQNYVRSAWTSMMNDSRPQTSSRASVNGTDAPDVNGQIAGGSDVVSPVPPQTPSDATSGLAEEQTLSASDFFFVSYPFADGCEGDMGSCPCGDDCQCIGCVIHGNAPAVETAPVQQPQS